MRMQLNKYPNNTRSRIYLFDSSDLNASTEWGEYIAALELSRPGETSANLCWVDQRSQVLLKTLLGRTDAEQTSFQHFFPKSLGLDPVELTASLWSYIFFEVVEHFCC